MSEDKTLPPKTGALTTRKGIEVNTLDDCYRVGNAVVASGLAPASFDTPEKCMIAIMHGAELGLGAMTSLKQIAVVNGRPSLWGDGVMALVLGSGLLEFFDERIEGEGDKREAVCVIQRKGLNQQTYTFSVDDAKKARLWTKKGPWQDYPERMLKMRARGFAMRDNFADYLSGIYIAEEAQDMPPGEMKDITPMGNPLDDEEDAPAIEAHKTDNPIMTMAEVVEDEEPAPLTEVEL